MKVNGNLINNNRIDDVFGIFDKSLLNTTNMYKAIVVNNRDILEDGYIQVALIGRTVYPYDLSSGFENNLFNLQRDASLVTRNSKSLDGERDKKIKEERWAEVSENIVSAYLATPYSGSYQNSGLFICPPVNSKGLVLNIDGDYIWLMGIFKPIPKKNNGKGNKSIFLPFPSNIVETDGLDLTDFNKNIKSNTIDRDKIEKERVLKIKKSDSYSNLTIVNPNSSSTELNNKNTIILRTVYPGGDKINILNDLKDRKEIGYIKSEDDINTIKKEYDRLNFPTETLLEISGERLWIHKANEWKTGNNKRKLGKIGTSEDKGFGEKLFIETKWIDFSINNLYGLDKFPHPDNKLKVLENKEDLGININNKYGVGYSINNISQKNNYKRNIEYNTETKYVKNLYNQNSENKKSRKVDVKINNDKETYFSFDLNNENKSISLSINLDNNNISVLASDIETNGKIELMIDVDNSFVKIRNDIPSEDNEFSEVELDNNGNIVADCSGDVVLSGEDGVSLLSDNITLGNKKDGEQSMYLVAAKQGSNLPGDLELCSKIQVFAKGKI